MAEERGINEDGEAPTPEDKENISPKLLNSGMYKLFCSRFLTAWGDRLWAFGLGVMIYKIRPKDLLLVSLYGLINCITTIIFGASIGNWIDSTTRLHAAKVFLGIQNSSVALACVILAVYFNWKDQFLDYMGEAATIVVAVLCFVISIISTLASMGAKIVVEKDWIVVIAGGDQDKLAKMNSIFRTIDLVCLTLTPTLAGILFEYTGYVFSASCIGGWNILSFFIEYYLLVSIYNMFPSLSEQQTSPQNDETEKQHFFAKILGSYDGWKFYFSHISMPAGLGLSLLYMTVLGFDNTTWAFSLMQCVSESVLGGLVAVSALIGILGSLCFPLLQHQIGVERTGMVGMLTLISTLSLCVASVWLPGSPFDPNYDFSVVESNSTEVVQEEMVQTECNNPIFTSVSVLLIGIILARFGLWIADLSISQIQQVEVQANKRGVVGGVQTSLNNFFDMTKFFLVILMPNPQTFGFLIVLSFISICLGGVSMTWYCIRRGKLNCFCCSTYQAAATKEPDNHKINI